MRILSVTGRESEFKLAFAGLHQLRLNQLRDVIARATTPASAHENAGSDAPI
jgi:hypothetical protein